MSHADTKSAPPAVGQEEYWNREGGERWVDNLARLDDMLAPMGELILDRAGLQAGEAALDVGCGGGATTRRIADIVGPSGSALGVDISAIILERADAAGTPGEGNVGFLRADAGGHDFGEAVFDVVFSRFGVMFFEDPVAAFRNLRRACKPGGRLVFLCWAAADENPWFKAPSAAAFSILPPPPPPDPEAPGPFSLADGSRLRDVLAAAGFANVQIEACRLDVDAAGGGGLDEAAAFAIDMMGPVRAALAEAGEEVVARVRAAVRAALGAYEKPQGVFVPTLTWAVTATRD